MRVPPEDHRPGTPFDPHVPRSVEIRLHRELAKQAEPADDKPEAEQFKTCEEQAAVLPLFVDLPSRAPV
ncbi:hypothetical protein ABT063_30935 [Streptomyces sp. NPDC002838]|uniref:hypothetical protein n=1 Tax=Streptomyces sp. NPDC002838 TaxID=3154436 RepID=UPI0033287012